MSETMYRQEYEADFVIFTGAIYGGAVDPQVLKSDNDIRAIIPEWPEIAAWRQVLVGIDTGADHPFGAVKLISTERGLVVIGEYLERHKSFVQHASSIKMLANYFDGKPTQSRVKYGINKNERQPTIELAQHGIYCQHAENDVVAGTERVKSWLQTRQLFFIEKFCPQTIKQMKAYRWAENTSPKDDQKRTERVYKVEDELPDCIRYALMTWPVLPMPVAPDAKPERDISNLPEKVQQDIRAMRKIDKPDVIKPNDVTGDFWL